MQFAVTFRHMEPTQALKDYAEERLLRIKKYFPDPIAVNVVMSTERYNHRVDVNVQLHNGLQIGGHESTENMYSSLDLVTAKLERQVRRYKTKLQAHRGKSKFNAIPYTHRVVTEGIELEDQTVPSIEDAPEIVTAEKFHAAPLSVPEAILQLNLVDDPFLVFRNGETGAVNVVYSRNDGSYGLIETPSGDQ